MKITRKLKKVPTVNCAICSKEFKPHWSKDYTGNFYCDKPCLYESRRGRVPWNKEKRGWNKGTGAGFKKGKENWSYKNEPWNKNLTWGNYRKIDPKKYKYVHYKIKSLYGSPPKCEKCGKVGNNRQIHWANKDGKYTLARNKWMRLCVACHIKHDGSNKTKKDLGLC